MGSISKIRLGKNETIENAVLLGTSQNWYDHVIIVAGSKYGVDPSKIKVMYLATKQLADLQGELFDTARGTGQVSNVAATKKHDVAGGGAQKQGSAARDIYAPLVFSRYVALADRRKDKGDVGSLQAPHLVAVFAGKEKADREAFVIISPVEGKYEVYDDLDAVKKRLYGEKARGKALLWSEGGSLAQAKQNLERAGHRQVVWHQSRHGACVKTLPILFSNSSARRTGRATSNSK